MRAALQLGLLLATAGLMAAQQTSDDLRHWRDVVAEGTPADAGTLPDIWTFNTPRNSFTVSTEPLKNYLRKGSEDDAVALEDWLDQLAAWLDAPEVRPDPSAGAKLRAILNRREFRPPRPPSRWEEWARELRRAILHFFDRLFSFAGGRPSGTQVLAWLLLIAGSGALVYLLLRTWRQEERSTYAPPGASPELGRDVAAWIAAAHAARRQGDLARAIQCCYWAAILHLQDRGHLPPHFAHTPREHLRLLAAAHQPTSALQALCTRLERCWYARVTPKDDDLAACFGALKELGCLVD